MDRARANLEPAGRGFSPVEVVGGPLDAGILVICDHASNALPPEYGSLGLEREALQRHIAYDLGARSLVRALAARLDAPAVLSTFSRLLIDPNRGADDPTLVMRYSDGAIVPGNARIDAAEIARRRDRFWAPYREKIAATVEAMLASGEPPALVSIIRSPPSGAERRAGGRSESYGTATTGSPSRCSKRCTPSRTFTPTGSATMSPMTEGSPATPSTRSRPPAASPTPSSRCGRT